QGVNPLLGLIAPPGSARRLVLRLGYRAARSLPRLRHPRYVTSQLATLRDFVSLRLMTVGARGAARSDRVTTVAEFRSRQVRESIARSRRNSRSHVLIIDHRIPTPDRDSGSFRMMEIIRAIKRRGHHVILIPDNMAVFSPYLENLERELIEVVYSPYFESA